MNIAFFLTPKSEVVCLKNDMTLRQAMEKMEYHRYSSVPMVDAEGHFCGVLTEGDILWEIRRLQNFSFKEAETIFIRDLPQIKRFRPVSINAQMDDLLDTISLQSFVPVVDDGGIFIGIIKRTDVIGYLYRQYKAARNAVSDPKNEAAPSESSLKI